ncbi:ABC transporter permease [Treponema parvum]|uniref:ABC transporter permease n=1 Tax=Treponema parvum TaxID=138851 RepID=A0A975F081_9SPIR|nr:FtsX-like permease family protein [Treponema parvum]QTQ12032.1 ABC transporter permease [Treponema parvum]QTQ15992.1 ABC transporter permease [Treponema parvum]
MTLNSSLLFARRLIFPRIEKKSSAHRSLLGALLCISISLVPLIVVLSVAEGMIEGITQRIIGLSSSHLQADFLAPGKNGLSLEYLDSAAKKLLSINGIVSSYPEIEGAALALSSAGRTGAAVRAVPSDIFQKNRSYMSLFSVAEGRADLTLSQNSAVIGKKIASDLGLSEGSSFRLVTSKFIAGRLVPRVTVFTVAGIVSCGYQELDSLWVFIPLEKGLSVLDPESSDISIKLETEDAFSSDLVRLSYEVQRAAGKNIRVYRWDELNVSEYENFASTKALLFFIMLLIVLVASVNIFSALIMLSMERRREIAVLKSFGATKRGITLSFLITGTVTGLGGLLAGLPAGILCAVNINKILLFIEKLLNFGMKFVYLLMKGNGNGFTKLELMDPAYYLQTIPVVIPLFELSVVAVGTLLLSLAASALPALRAGSEKPIETFRKT